MGTDEQTSDDVWDVALDVNLRAHVHAARLLVPDWLERGTDGFSPRRRRPGCSPRSRDEAGVAARAVTAAAKC